MDPVSAAFDTDSVTSSPLATDEQCHIFHCSAAADVAFAAAAAVHLLRHLLSERLDPNPCPHRQKYRRCIPDRTAAALLLPRGALSACSYGGDLAGGGRCGCGAGPPVDLSDHDPHRTSP